MATTSQSGTSVIWDLKQKRPIVPFQNPNARIKRRYSSIAWNPEVATQLAIACEDDHSPVIELWDLRQAYEPLKELKGPEGHAKGILALSWCPDDSNLLLSCGKDNRCIVWNPNTGETLGELPSAKSWMYDVQWSYRPSILSTASHDGSVIIHSLQDSSARVIRDKGDFAEQIQQKPVKSSVFKTAPKWLKRPVGASFGFGGKLVSFNSTSREITVSQVVTEPEFFEKCKSFENVLKTGKYKEFCQEKIDSAKDEQDKCVWSIMKILFEDV